MKEEKKNFIEKKNPNSFFAFRNCKRRSPFFNFSRLTKFINYKERNLSLLCVCLCANCVRVFAFLLFFPQFRTFRVYFIFLSVSFLLFSVVPVNLRILNIQYTGKR